MNSLFARNSIAVGILLAFPCATTWVIAQPYPALPPSLSTSVTPNVILYLDTSGSMLQDADNNWMLRGLCDSNVNWSNCVNTNTNGYRTSIDSEAVSPNTKMNIAKRVARNIVENNKNLRFGLFSFEDTLNSVGGAERGQGAILRSPVMNMNVAANKDAMFTAINALNGRTSTPLGEGLLEVTQYLRGAASLNGKAAGITSGVYTSPIQYRCQKNFAIVVTDGDASDDANFNEINYTARDGNGTAVAKKFNVCTAANAVGSNDVDVNCPATYEGSATARTWGNGDNRPGALRDVAKYANVADLRVGGTDLDGKSFDDPKFARQNLTTYTIGFGVRNDVLPAAANVGGGASYTANSEDALNAALTSAVNSITASISNAGGLATVSEISQAGNKIFQPVFNPKGWYGELRCFDFSASVGIGAACSPNAKAVIPPGTETGGRNIYTSVVSGTAATGFSTSAFDFKVSNFNLMSSQQKTNLGASDAARKNVINFIRGVEGIAGFRSRYNPTVGSTVLMGDVIDGQPVVVGKPNGSTTDSSYSSFVSANASRNYVFIGANDGMLHGFKIDPAAGSSDNMMEVMGYVPSSVYSGLPALSASDYGSITPHRYHVNGVIKQGDVKISSTWKTLLVGGLAQGGQSYYAIDATDASTLGAASSAVKWEFNDTQSSSMGYSFGAPLIYNVRLSSNTVIPAVILSNGYESDFDDTAQGGKKTATKASVLYIINAETGGLIKSIEVPSGGGLSSPAGVDVGQDGILDYVYAGDMNGKMWRFDLTSNQPSDFKVAPNPIFDAGVNSPITMRPAVMPVFSSADSSSLGNLILFGTGKLLTDSDRSDTATQSLYGILDKMDETPTTVPNTVGSTALQQQTFTDTLTVSGAGSLAAGTYRKVSNNAVDLTDPLNTYLGWVIRLPVASERLVSTPLVYGSKVLFGTGVPKSTEQCLPGGSGWIIGLNPLTGSTTRKDNKSTGTEYSFIDLNNDGKSSARDRVPFSSGSGYVAGYAKDGIPTEISYVASSSVLSGPGDPISSEYGAAGAVIALREANSQGVYSGNGRRGITTGLPMKRPVPSDDGFGCTGTVGSDSVDCRKVNKPASAAARLSSTLWREIK